MRAQRCPSAGLGRPRPSTGPPGRALDPLQCPHARSCPRCAGRLPAARVFRTCLLALGGAGGSARTASAGVVPTQTGRAAEASTVGADRRECGEGPAQRRRGPGGGCCRRPAPPGTGPPAPGPLLWTQSGKVQAGSRHRPAGRVRLVRPAWSWGAVGLFFL